jgi:hypothetical protein
MTFVADIWNNYLTIPYQRELSIFQRVPREKPSKDRLVVLRNQDKTFRDDRL